jgi:transcriptional repressor NrdR
MMCPFCQEADTRVVDSRLDVVTNQVRRRRECGACSQRFTTFEQPSFSLPSVIKSAGFSEPFSEAKLRKGFAKALEKRPVSQSQVDAVVARILHQIRSNCDKEIAAKSIGHMVMTALKEMDPIAYVRFASIYLSFQDIEAFRSVLEELETEKYEG